MELELTQGKTTVIDDEDYELASRYSWFPRTDKKSGTVYVANMKGNKNHARGGRYKYKKPFPIEYYI
jgi:hypothetical protein